MWIFLKLPPFSNNVRTKTFSFLFIVSFVPSLTILSDSIESWMSKKKREQNENNNKNAQKKRRDRENYSSKYIIFELGPRQ